MAFEKEQLSMVAEKQGAYGHEKDYCYWITERWRG